MVIMRAGSRKGDVLDLRAFLVTERGERPARADCSAERWGWLSGSRSSEPPHLKKRWQFTPVLEAAGQPQTGKAQ